jgi:hypothetical protein
MDINQVFPTKYLSAGDLQGKAVQVQIAHVVLEVVGNPAENLPVMYFHGKAKGVVLNKTNANAVAQAYGPDTDNWPGKLVEVFPSTTEFAGKIVDCIRMRPFVEGVTTPSIDQQPIAPAPPTPAAAVPVMDDDIPFN